MASKVPKLMTAKPTTWKQRIASTLLLLGVAIGFAACASTETDSAPPNTTRLTGRREIPWNTPQSWEGLGPLGGYADQIGTR